MKGNGLNACSQKCRDLQECCPVEDCRQWIDFEEDLNCAFVAIYENGPMTLRMVGDRLGISFARVKQIEQRAMLKMRRIANNWQIY